MLRRAFEHRRQMRRGPSRAGVDFDAPDEQPGGGGDDPNTVLGVTNDGVLVRDGGEVVTYG